MPSVAFVLWALIIGVQGTVPGSPVQDEPDNTATISGVVTRIGTGEPIVRASLFLEPVINPTDPDAAINALLAREQAPGGTTDFGGNYVIEGIKRAPVRANGSFSLSGIAAGEYYLFAWESAESVAYMKPAFLRRFEERATRVGIQENDALKVNPEVIPESETR